MKLCICGKTQKQTDLSPNDVKVFWLLIFAVFIIALAYDVYLSIAFTFLVVALTSVLAFLRLLRGHKFVCSARWAYIFIARITQYF